MESAIAVTVQWIIVPIIMLALLVFAWIIAGSVSDSELKVSAWAGFWAGLVLFVVYVVSQLGAIRTPSFNLFNLPGLLLFELIVGLVLGFLFLWMVRVMIPTRLVGLITLLLAFASTSSLFSYVFLNDLRISVLYMTLGGALGILLHIVLFPASVREIFSK
jgi:hypothetical protein